MKKCPDCGIEGFLSKGDVYRHRRQSHGYVTCTCKREFLKTEYMEQHRRMIREHVPETGPFKCFDCSRRFLKSYRLGNHKKLKGHDGMKEVGSMPDPMHDIWLKDIPPDLYLLQSSEIDSFIDKHVQADSIFKRCCGEVTDTLISKLQDIQSVYVKLEPKRIIKSGSMGKGTAVKNRADIDLVMMLNQYTDVDQLMSDMEDILRDLELYLIRYATHQKTTSYSVQVEITCSNGHKHDVDILPAVDLLEIGYTPAAVFRKMKGASEDILHEYSVTLAPLQLKIIKALPSKVKKLIKLVKYWKDKKLKEDNEAKMPSLAEKQKKRPNWPSSYALELVVINAWNEAGNKDGFDMTQVLHAVLTSLKNHSGFKVILKEQMKYSIDLIGVRDSPYIMDPANPFNDMYHGLVGGKAFDWYKVVPEAKRWLKKPLFNGVS